MARIVVGATMIRYPLGGMNLWILAWLVGFQRLGHDVDVDFALPCGHRPALGNPCREPRLGCPDASGSHETPIDSAPCLAFPPRGVARGIALERGFVQRHFRSP